MTSLKHSICSLKVNQKDVTTIDHQMVTTTGIAITSHPVVVLQESKITIYVLFTVDTSGKIVSLIRMVLIIVRQVEMAATVLLVVNNTIINNHHPIATVNHLVPQAMAVSNQLRPVIIAVISILKMTIFTI